MLFFTLLFAFSIPISTLANEIVPYGPGEWDVIYSKTITATSSGTNTSTVTSGGGDIRACISGVEYGNSVNLQFYTSTGSILPLMSIFNNNGSPSTYHCFEKIDVRPYVNSSGKVNLYLKVVSKNRSSDNVYIVIED